MRHSYLRLRPVERARGALRLAAGFRDFETVVWKVLTAMWLTAPYFLTIIASKNALSWRLRRTCYEVWSDSTKEASLAATSVRKEGRRDLRQVGRDPLISRILRASRWRLAGTYIRPLIVA